jgi:peptidoglycan/LPS O-acetylase OafA/YrhL
VSFATITLGVASQRVFIVVSVYFVIDSVRNLLDTPSYPSRFTLNRAMRIY